MPENLTPKKRKVLEALLTHWDTSAAAALAGVSRDTVYRWMKEPAFREALQNATTAALEALSRGLVTLGGKALEVLSAALEDDTPQALQVRSADIILTKILSIGEFVDMETRLSELEKANKNVKPE